MAVSLTFMPKRLTDILNYAVQLHDTVSASGYDPTTVGLAASDVMDLGTKLTAARTAFSAAHALKASSQSATQALSGPGAAMEQLVQDLRDLANKARASTATDDALAGIGISRRNGPTPIGAPTDAPEFTLEHVTSNRVNVRFRETGSANPRSKPADVAGAQIAIVNGANAPVDGEENHAPNVLVTRSPAALNSEGWPGSVRLYARWFTAKGLTGPWSVAVPVIPQ
jgi:hypothetical protein